MGKVGVVATDLECPTGTAWWLWGMGCADRTMEEALVLSRNKCRKPGGRRGRGSLEKSWDSQEKWSVWVSSQLLPPAFPLEWSKRSPVLDALLGRWTLGGWVGLAFGQ